jgi:hypothetical protein
MAKAQKKSRSQQPAAAAKRPVHERVREYASSPCYAHEFDNEMSSQPEASTEECPSRPTRGDNESGQS